MRGKVEQDFLSDSWTFDLTHSSWDQLSPATSPPNREGSSLAFDPSLKVFLLFGGKNENYLNDTWIFDPVSLNWFYLTPSELPDARAFASMAFDEKHNVFVLFGGKDNSGSFNDTWSFNPEKGSWKALNPSGSPSARNSASMDYDAKNKKFVLFGGINSGVSLGDTWIFNLSSLKWTQLNPAMSPSARYSASFAYGPVSNQFILFGGQNGGGLNNETWAFDLNEKEWTQLYPAHTPSPRAGAAFDSMNAVFTIFGGQTNSGLNNSTWEFTPEHINWLKLNSHIYPSERAFASLAFNSISGFSLLFGGEGKLGYLGDTWYLGVVNAEPLLPPENAAVRQVKNRFTTQTDLINVVSWTASPEGEIPVRYRIYRNPELTHLAGKVDGDKGKNGVFTFRDENLQEGISYDYYIVAVDIFGNISHPASVIFTPDSR